ncbi:MAG: DUF4248 domain-containing protein [Bacteroidaceae bacterium]|nr:DUF4248 domain-containing protein [Bacteroidaceae bacterium]
MNYEEEEYEIDIVSMTKTELAMLYAPDLTPHSAVNRLAKWIACNKLLTAALRRTGYRKTARRFSPKQVKLIFHYLGEP